MRIISQNGRYDFPYEKFLIRITENNEIFVQDGIKTGKNNSIMIAKYSNKEILKNAMNDLYSAYKFQTAYENSPNKVKTLLFNNMTEKEQSRLLGVFRFPPDNKIDVGEWL